MTIYKTMTLLMARLIPFQIITNQKNYEAPRYFFTRYTASNPRSDMVYNQSKCADFMRFMRVCNLLTGNVLKRCTQTIKCFQRLWGSKSSISSRVLINPKAALIRVTLVHIRENRMDLKCVFLAGK